MKTLSSLQVFLLVFVATVPSAVTAQSFDCGKAQTESEIAICQNEHLSRLDEDLLRVYRAALAAGDRESVKVDGRRLLAKRRDCRGDVVCLESEYRRSIDFFSNAASQNDFSDMNDVGEECDGCDIVVAEEKAESTSKTKPATAQTCKDGIGILIAALKLRQSGYDLLGAHEKVVSDVQGDERLAYIVEEPTFSSDMMDMVRVAYSGQFDGFDLNTVQALMISNCLNQ